MNGLLHKRLPESMPVNLNIILLLDKIIQVLIREFSVNKGISWNRNSIHFKPLKISRNKNHKLKNI